MPQPNVRELIVAGPLQNISVAYRNKSYVGDRVFPIVDNAPPDAKIARYLKGAWFRNEADVRGPGARAKRGGYPVDFLSVAIKEYAFAKEVTDEDRLYATMQGAPPLKPDQDAVEFCSDKIDLKKEKVISDLIRAQTWADGVSGGEDAEGLWAAGVGNTFLADIRKGAKTIQAASGVLPNVLLIDFGTYNSLKEESTVLDKIKYTERGILTTELLAALLDLEEVLVGTAIYSSAKEKKTGLDWTSVQIWETNAGKGMGFLFYRPPTPGLKTPSAGLQVRCPYEDNQSRRITTWREAAEHQDVYEVAEKVDIVVSGLDLGYLWVDTLLT